MVGGRKRSCLVPWLPSQARILATCSALPEEGGVEGNPSVQDALADLLQMEVRRQQVKADLMSDIETKKEGLRKIGEEMQERLAEQYEIEKARTDLAGMHVVSETFEQLDELEEQVRRVKEQVQIDKADLAAWEQKAAAEKSQGLFFQSLYQSDRSQPVGGGLGSSDSRPARADERNAQGTASPSSQLASPWRLGLYTYLASVLVLVLSLDLVSGAPSLAQDALYGGLAGLLGYTAFRERQALLESQASAGPGAPENKKGP